MTVRIINADVLEGLKQLADESVNCCVTSPPYFGLRDYQTATWEGGDAGCDHLAPAAHGYRPMETSTLGPKKDGISASNSAHADGAKRQQYRGACKKCGAERVDHQIGLEATPSEFVARLVEVFREVRRVLRKDGSLWLNIGDSYNNADKWGGGGANTGKHTKDGNGKVPSWEGVRRKWKGADGCKPKDLIGTPWMLAFALRADGWWLRSANVWAKPNGMPESQRDRPVVGHEYVFQLTKSERYYYGYDDVKMPAVPVSVERLARAMRRDLDAGDFVLSGGGYAPPGQSPHQGARKTDKQRGHNSRRHAGFNDRWDAKEKAEQQADGAALRSVWWIAPGGFPDAHFATMPEELAALLVQCGCPQGGVALDPFGGAGTTGVVADRLGRDAVLIELNPEYVGIIERRIATDRLNRKVGTMDDVAAARLPKTPLEELMEVR